MNFQYKFGFQALDLITYETLEFYFWYYASKLYKLAMNYLYTIVLIEKFMKISALTFAEVRYREAIDIHDLWVTNIHKDNS